MGAELITLAIEKKESSASLIQNANKLKSVIWNGRSVMVHFLARVLLGPSGPEKGGMEGEREGGRERNLGRTPPVIKYSPTIQFEEIRKL